MRETLRIAHIIPGSGGGFYCGNCLRDSKFFEATRAQGHEVVKIPMYLPLFANEIDNLHTPVFYGAVSLYLKEKIPLMRYAPKWVDRLLNAGPVLRYAARRATSTRAKGLEQMTISMLMGEEGRQNKELEQMVDWLEKHFKADVVHISNALLLGLAHQLKERLKVPVICSLQDEDVWVDGMDPRFAEQVWELMRTKTTDIDRFVAVSHFYAGFMQKKLNLRNEQLITLHLGVDPDDYRYRNASEKGRNIGYLSRLCYENGVDILAEAFILLKQRGGTEDIRLILTGGYTGDDLGLIRQMKRQFAEAGLEKSVVWADHFGQEARNNFFDQVSVLSVPVRHGEAFGIYLTEALASGIPVVQPPLGAFPEIINQSGGGIVYQKNSPEALAEALFSLLNDPEQMQHLSKKGREAAVNQFNIHRMVEAMTGIYREEMKNEE
jgi:glycosyltransferase involved in cell wall biosynthesis